MSYIYIYIETLGYLVRCTTNVTVQSSIARVGRISSGKSARTEIR